MDAETLKKMFEESNKRSAESKGPGKVDFSPEEADKFKKAFDDAEFRKMFSEYMVIFIFLIKYITITSLTKVFTFSC